MAFEIWLERLRRSFQSSVPKDDAFWIRQKASILEQLPPRRGASGWRWRHWATPVLAFGMLVSVQGWRVHHRTTVRQEMAIAQNVDLLENMDMIEHLDVLEDASFNAVPEEKP